MAACAPKPAPAPKQPEATTPKAEPAQPSPAPQLARPSKPRPNVTYYSADLQVQGLDDLMQSSDKLASHWDAQRSMPTRDLVSTFLNNLGFASNFLDLVNLSQPFLAHFDLPHNTKSSIREHFDVALSVPASDPSALVKGFPAKLKLESQGQAQWKASLPDLELSLKADAGFLSVARSVKNLARAAQDRQSKLSPQGPRLSLHLDELSDNQRRAVLNSIPQSISRRLYPALKDLSSLTLSLDLGSERPLLGKAFAVAPWKELKLPLSSPTTAPSAVAQKLPAGAATVSQVMLGDTKPIIDQLQSLVQKKVPAPFTDPGQEILTALQNLSNQVSSHVIAAYYLDKKNQASLLFAADLKDDTQGLAAVEALWTALANGVQMHIDLVKNSPEDRYTLTQKNKGPRYYGQRTQSLKITVPKRLVQDLAPQKDFALASPLMSGSGNKRRLEGYSFVRDGYAVLALGAGSKSLIRSAIRLAKEKKPSAHLESSMGLANAKSATQGCQICGFIDPLATLRALAVHAAAESGRTKDLRSTLKELDKIKLEGVISGGAHLEADKGNMAMHVPLTLVYPEQKEAVKLKKAIKGFEILDDILPEQAKAAAAR